MRQAVSVLESLVDQLTSTPRHASDAAAHSGGRRRPCRYGAVVDMPAYWLRRPAMRTDAETLTAFDRLLDQALAQGPERPIDYRLGVPVAPAAKLAVGPADFLFLEQIRGHDDDLHRARMAADPDGFPRIEA